MNLNSDPSSGSSSVQTSSASSVPPGFSSVRLAFSLSDLQVVERELSREWWGLGTERHALSFLPFLSLDGKTRHLESFPEHSVASALGGAAIHEWISSAASWRKFSPSAQALALRKSNRFGSFFNEVGEELQEKGLATLYRGFMIPELPVTVSLSQLRTLRERSVDAKPKHWAVLPFHRVNPRSGQVLGQTVLDFSESQRLPVPRALPLEFSARTQSQEAMPELSVSIQTPSGRRVLGMEEAVSISGLSSRHLEKAFFLSAWIFGWLQTFWQDRQIQMNQVNLRFADGGEGRLILLSLLDLHDFDLGLSAPESAQEALHQVKSFAHATSGDQWFLNVEPLKVWASRSNVRKEVSIKNPSQKGEE